MNAREFREKIARYPEPKPNPDDEFTGYFTNLDEERRSDLLRTAQRMIGNNRSILSTAAALVFVEARYLAIGARALLGFLSARRATRRSRRALPFHP